MVFSSLLFLLYFLPPVLGVAWLMSGSQWNRAANIWLLAASLVFYAWGAPRFLPILLVACVVNHRLVLAMSGAEGRRRDLLKKLAIGLHVGLLVTYKYLGLLVASAFGLLGLGDAPDLGIALPIGISFFTFQAISYVMDVDRRDAPPVDGLTDYLVYILSFPQMIAGPIVRFTSVQAALRKREVTVSDWQEGAYRFGVGLAKKVFIANALAAIYPLEASALDGTMAMWGSSEAVLGLLAYSFQIYFDFSGYSDMAIGLGRMLGFRFPENFKHPYRSGSITEFWRRWHITLGDWMRDYLYIPLGGNRLGPARTHLNLVTVFAISGLWHGASWNFLLWGLYHGLFLLLDRWFLLRWLEGIPRVLRSLLTFSIATVGWIVFALPEFGDAGAFSTRLLGFHGAGWAELENKEAFIMAVALILVFVPVRRLGERMLPRPAMRLVLGTALWMGAILELSAGGFNPFIYFRF